jgi:hypothetical protein
MEDDLKKIRNGRRPHKKMEDNLKKNKKMEDDLKKKIREKKISIPLKYGRRPQKNKKWKTTSKKLEDDLGLAQLSKIFLLYYSLSYEFLVILSSSLFIH